MPPKKQQTQPKHKFNDDDLSEKEVHLKPLPWFAYKSNDPNFSGITFLGKSPEEALQNARAHATVYYKHKFRVAMVIDE